MAIRKEVEIDVNTTAGEKALKDLGGSFEDVYGEAKPLSGIIGELEDRLYEMAQAGEAGTKEFNDLTQEIGAMKKIILDTDLAVDGMSQTMAQNMGGALEGVTGAFALGTGAMGAMGVESEKVEEMLLRVQSAMAISQGLESIRQAAPAFKALGVSAKKALSSIKFGIAATGIGLFVVAIAAVATNWDKVTKALGKQTKAQKLSNEAGKEAISAIKEELSASDKLQKVLEDESISREDKVKAVKDLQAEYPELLANIDAEKTSTEDINKALKLNTELLELNAKVKALASLRAEQMEKQLQAEIDATTGANEGIMNSLQAFGLGVDAKELAIQKSQAIINTTNEETAAIDNLTASLEKEIEALKERGATVTEEAEKDTGGGDNNAWKERQQARLEAERQIEDMRLQNLQDGKQKELEILQTEYDRERQLVLDNTLTTETQKHDLIEQLNEQARQRRNQIEEEYRIELQTLELERITMEEEEKRTMTLGLNQLTQEQLNTMFTTANEERFNKFRDSMAEMEAASGDYFQATQDGLNAMSALNDLLTDQAVKKAKGNAAAEEKARKKGFERSKKLQLVSAVITGIQGVMAAFTAGASMGPAGVVMGPLMAGIAAVTAGINIAKIAATKYEGGGTGGGGTAPRAPSVPSPANFNVVGNDGNNQLAETLGEQQPIKAQVVASEVTTAQSLDRNKIENASL